MIKFIAVHMKSSGNQYVGVFDSKDEAWSWINNRDPHRLESWSLISFKDKEEY